MKTITIASHGASPREINVRRRLNRAIKRAFQVCLVDSTTPACRDAWMDVDELSNALYDIKMTRPKSVYEQLCREEPDDV